MIDQKHIHAIEDAWNYDGRTPNSRGLASGHIGHAACTTKKIAISRSYADPFQGINPEMLVLTESRGKTICSGYSDTGKRIRQRLDIPLSVAAQRLADCPQPNRLLHGLPDYLDPGDDGDIFMVIE